MPHALTKYSLSSVLSHSRPLVRQRRRPPVTLALVLAVALLGRPRAALAHAIVIRTDPADGAVLSAPPPQVRLWFSEPVVVRVTTVQLVEGQAWRFTLQAAAPDGKSESDVRVIALPGLSPDVFNTRRPAPAPIAAVELEQWLAVLIVLAWLLVRCGGQAGKVLAAGTAHRPGPTPPP